jgi:hypothetical protein
MAVGLLGGLLGEGINEVIATTFTNAAPMGIINRGDKGPRMVLFRGSHTAKNVERYGWIVANITYDPLIWVRTAFEDLPPEYFTDLTFNCRPMYRLRDCEAWIAFEASIENETKDNLIVRLTPLTEGILSTTPRPVNRGFNSVIEATVHATRYVRFKDPKLLELIEHHARIVRKCGGKMEVEAMEMLREFIEREERSD